MRFTRPVFCALSLLAAACGDDSDEGFPTGTAEQAVADYKTLVYANYEDVLAEARLLQTAIHAFVAAPTRTTQDAAKQAWIAARLPYGPSEIFRFYEGPIDNSVDGPEGLINAWPLDENYIDYTRDMPDVGIVNDVAGTPQITAEALASANEFGGEANIATGYHAIEFLLWGQDDEVAGQGQGKRSFTDYLAADQGGTHENPERRAAYLSTVTDLLIADLEQVTSAWAPDADNFAASFGITPEDPDAEPDAKKEAISKILTSLGSMANAELSGERMTVAYINRSQEDEHSCFSDNTAVDLLGNGIGIRNVWLGTYGDFDGVGIDEVVRKLDADLADQMTTDIEDAVIKLQALVDYQNAGEPIDVVINAADGSSERAAMLDAITALKIVGDDVEKAATALGLSVQLEAPSVEFP